MYLIKVWVIFIGILEGKKNNRIDYDNNESASVVNGSTTVEEVISHRWLFSLARYMHHPTWCSKSFFDTTLSFKTNFIFCIIYYFKLFLSLVFPTAILNLFPFCTPASQLLSISSSCFFFFCKQVVTTTLI